MAPTVAVVGLGTTGAQALWQLARRGADVVGFETWAPGHSRGAAGGENRLFRTVELDDHRYSPLVDRAEELWDELGRESGRELLVRTGVLLMGERDSRQMRTATENVRRTGTPHQWWEAAELARRFPQFRLGPDDAVLWDERGGWVRPEMTVATAAALAEDLGATVHRDRRVRAVEPHGDRVRVVTDDAAVEVDRVVVAAGAWTSSLLPSLAGVLATRRLVSTWFFGRDARYLDGLPPFLRTEPSYCYGIPTADGTAVKLGLGFPHHLVVDDPDTVDRVTRAEELVPFQEAAARYLPGLDTHPMRVETYLENYTPDRREWVGPLPGAPQITVLAGFSGHGFKLSPAIGELAADHVLGTGTRVPAGFLLPRPAESGVAG